MLFDRDFGIILACDVETLGNLELLIRVGETSKTVVGYKVGFALGLMFGLPRVVETIRSRSTRCIIYDHQKAGTDIPRMGDLFARTCKGAGIDGIIIFPLAGPKTMLGFVDAIQGVGATPIVGGVMTHQAFLKSEGGFIVDSAPEEIYRIAAEHGVEHFVLPGNKPVLITQFAQKIADIRGESYILMPGIGTQGGQVAEAFRAAGLHRRYAIVGSAIYDATDKEAALANIARQVEEYKSKP